MSRPDCQPPTSQSLSELHEWRLAAIQTVLGRAFRHDFSWRDLNNVECREVAESVLAAAQSDF